MVAARKIGRSGRTNRRIATRAARRGGAGVVVSTDADRDVAGWLLPWLMGRQMQMVGSRWHTAARLAIREVVSAVALLDAGYKTRR